MLDKKSAEFRVVVCPYWIMILLVDLACHDLPALYLPDHLQ